MSRRQRTLVPCSKLLAIAIASSTLIFPCVFAAASPLIVTGPGEAHAPQVNRITVDPLGGDDIVTFQAYPRSFRGGVRVAAGDVNGDGIAEIITAPGPGEPPIVEVFDGATNRPFQGRLRRFLAFAANFRGGVFVASADVNGDGKADIIVSPSGNAPPAVRVFDGATGAVIHSFLAFNGSFRGGVRVAAGDVNGDGFADVIAAAGP